MDAVRFLKERARQLGVGESCLISMKAKDAEVLVAETEKWSREHPRKTRKSIFLHMFPNARTYDDGTLAICPEGLGLITHREAKCGHTSCFECYKNFWEQEVEDDEEN